MNLKGKKILVLGLGLLGGGVSTANWLLKKGAKVTVTDLKNRKQLKTSLERIRGNICLVLGKHSNEDIENNDVIVVNPDISFRNPYVRLAKKLKKQIENEATLYYKNLDKPRVAITGTRGKTTTVNWTAYFMKASAVGNSNVNPYLKMISKNTDCAVTELPSFLLELFDAVPPPHVAVITNVYRDHLNRYRSIRDYANTKANIFRCQTAKDYLILNYEDRWTRFFLKQKPKGKVLYFSNKTLLKGNDGVFLRDGYIFFQIASREKAVLDVRDFTKKWGLHNVSNLMAASLAAHINGVSWFKMSRTLKTLPQTPFRLETIYEDEKIQIVNDTTATSPEGCMAAIQKFASPYCILLSGGTDRNLEFKDWAKVAKTYLKKENIFLLKGSATNKMLKYLKGVAVFNSFEEMVRAGLNKAAEYEKSVVLFSPASKSFEKFKNEYDRGEKFNQLILKWIKHPRKHTKNYSKKSLKI